MSLTYTVPRYWFNSYTIFGGGLFLPLFVSEFEIYLCKWNVGVQGPPFHYGRSFNRRRGWRWWLGFTLEQVNFPVFFFHYNRKYFSVNCSVEFKHVNSFLKWFLGWVYDKLVGPWPKNHNFQIWHIFLMITEIFFGLGGHKRMGKTCATKIFFFETPYYECLYLHCV